MNSYFVTLKSSFSIDDALQLLQEKRIKIEEIFRFSGTLVVRCDPDTANQMGGWDCVESVNNN